MSLQGHRTFGMSTLSRVFFVDCAEYKVISHLSNLLLREPQRAQVIEEIHRCVFQTPPQHEARARETDWATEHVVQRFRKKYFLRRKIFLVEKNISCGKKYFLRKKNIFLAEKNLFLAEKIYFLRRKIYFLRRKIFLAEKKIFLAEKYFCTMLPISFRRLHNHLLSPAQTPKASGRQQQCPSLSFIRYRPAGPATSLSSRPAWKVPGPTNCFLNRAVANV